MFVSKSPVPVTLDNVNFIYIKARLNYGEMKRIQKAAIKIKKNASAASDAEIEFDTSAYQQGLLVESLLSWSGPAFEGRPCTPENIAELDPDEPLLDKVIKEISERNKDNGDDPKASLGVGESPYLATENLLSANMTST